MTPKEKQIKIHKERDKIEVAENAIKRLNKEIRDIQRERQETQEKLFDHSIGYTKTNNLTKLMRQLNNKLVRSEKESKKAVEQIKLSKIELLKLTE